MRKLLLALLVSGLAMAMSPGAAMAGGSSDSTGEAFHCYLFFDLPDEKFAQVMINDSEATVVVEKANEAIDKYELDELGILSIQTGNVKNCLPEDGEPTLPIRLTHTPTRDRLCV